MERSTQNRRRDDSDEDAIEDVESPQPQRRARRNGSDDEMEGVQDASQAFASAAAAMNSKNKGKGKKRAATPLSDDGSGPEADPDQDLPPFDPTAFRDQQIPGRASVKFAELFQIWHKGIAPLDFLEKNIREVAVALTEAGEEGNTEVYIPICHVRSLFKECSCGASSSYFWHF